MVFFLFEEEKTGLRVYSFAAQTGECIIGFDFLTDEARKKPFKPEDQIDKSEIDESRENTAGDANLQLTVLFPEENIKVRPSSTGRYNFYVFADTLNVSELSSVIVHMLTGIEGRPSPLRSNFTSIKITDSLYNDYEQRLIPFAKQVKTEVQEGYRALVEEERAASEVKGADRNR